MKRVVIVGLGFGGLQAAKHLADKGFDVLVLDRNNYHLFQPLLYQVATATLNQEAIASSIRAIVRGWRGVRFEMVEVQGIDFEARQVQTSAGALGYDYLILAAGSATNYFGMEAVQQHAFDLKQLGDAVKLRNHILSVYEAAAKATDPAVRDELLSFVIVGGGPTGVEFAGSLSELARHVLHKDFPELQGRLPRIVLLEAMDRILASFSPLLRSYARRRLESMGVEVRTNAAVSDATADRVRLKDGTQIPTRTLFWAAGVKAAPLAEGLALRKSKGGTIVVEPDLSVEEHPEVFVVGDMACFEQDGKPLPMVAPVAMQGGEYVAGAILRRESGQPQVKPAPPFRYFDRGSMAVIGRNTAVAQSFGIKMMGFTAWLAWLGLHLYYLIGFRNRVVTLINWAYDYILFDRQVRLITRNGDKSR